MDKRSKTNRKWGKTIKIDRWIIKDNKTKRWWNILDES
jgi:hypothetical protein